MFQKEKVERDKQGMYLHSALKGLSDDVDITELAVSDGMEFEYADFDSDAPKSLREEYEAIGLDLFGDWESIVKRWKPKPPKGKGWFLAAIYGTEDGFGACFARPSLRQNKRVGEL